MATDGHVIHDSSAYRRGLVLGLTMAEIMLLLVFCLLIAMATFLRKEEVARKAAKEELARLQVAAAADHAMVESLKKNPRLAELLKQVPKRNNTAAADQYWRDLVESKSLASAAKEAGYTRSDLRELRREGVTGKRALKDASIVRAGEKALGGRRELTAKVMTDALGRVAEPAKESGHHWPPIITLNDTKGQFFKSGSAELNTAFRQKIVGVEPQILKLMSEYQVDVIEVVGHTDEQPVGARPSNLDSDLPAVLRGQATIGSAVSADNAGLGLARAVSVVSVLRQNPNLAKYKILPLSGGELINTNETLATTDSGGNEPERRRIEIRLRKGNPEVDAAKAVIQPAGVSITPVPKRRLPSRRSRPVFSRDGAASRGPLVITPNGAQ